MLGRMAGYLDGFKNGSMRPHPPPSMHRLHICTIRAGPQRHFGTTGSELVIGGLEELRW
jgi:hypothetical protein